MFALSYIQGGKVQYWKNEAINLIAAGQELFKDFKDFIAQMEAQFGDLSSKATTNKFNVLTMEETQDECFLKPKTNCI